jgi:hypothetical protein
MGKRRRNDRMTLPGKAGFSKVRKCTEHGLIVNPVRVFGQGMYYQCKEGCMLDKSVTRLVNPEATRGTR